MNALVLGGTRFVGRHLVERLLREGVEVTLLHTGNQNPFGARVEHVVVDRRDHDAVANALGDRRFTWVFDHAYIQPTGTTPALVQHTLRLVGEHARRYVFTSSVAVYDVGTARVETDPMATRGDPYSVHKIGCEAALKAWAKATGGSTAVLRPASILGPFNRGYQLRFFWDRMRAKLPIILPDGGDALMQFTYGPDVADALWTLATHPQAHNETFNMAWPETISQRDFVHALGSVSGHRPELVEVPRKLIFGCGGNPFDGPLYFGESLDVVAALGEFSVAPHKLVQTLGFFMTPWLKALEATFAWYEAEHVQRLTTLTAFEQRVLSLHRGAS